MLLVVEYIHVIMYVYLVICYFAFYINISVVRFCSLQGRMFARPRCDKPTSQEHKLSQVPLPSSSSASCVLIMQTATATIVMSLAFLQTLCLARVVQRFVFGTRQAGGFFFRCSTTNISRNTMLCSCWLFFSEDRALSVDCAVSF